MSSMSNELLSVLDYYLGSEAIAFDEAKCDQLRAKMSEIRFDDTTRAVIGSTPEVWRALSTNLRMLRNIKATSTADKERTTFLIRTVISLVMNLLAGGEDVQKQAMLYVKSELFDTLDDENVIESGLAVHSVRALVNLGAANNAVKDELWPDFLSRFTPESIDRICASFNHEGYSALLIFVVGCVGTAEERASIFMKSPGGRRIYLKFIEHVDSWMQSTGDQNFDLMYKITQSLIQGGYFPDIYSLCSDPIEQPSGNQLVAMKLLDGYLSSPKTVTAINCIELAQFLYKDTFVELGKPLAIQIMSKKIDNPHSERVASFLTVSVECMTSLTSISQEIRNLFIELGCIPELIDLLRRADELIPRKTLKTQQASEQSTSKAYEFPDLKRQIVGLLSYLVEGNRVAQDQIRTSGGLPVVLSQCNIDDNNPFIREYAILLIKNLLADNQENQDFVASLEAREAVTSDALHEAGYETSIIDGKVSLRKR
ncbi:spinocerebellar ataxia type 10 protein domain-containing protein [Myxozyma melibiosi]|uniref:Ataxin-10 homolog n=1 Tax=Myxozyma melibiosi TaxID=54550 RepID=A0ABR1FDV8_9ASCO